MSCKTPPTDIDCAEVFQPCEEGSTNNFYSNALSNNICKDNEGGPCDDRPDSSKYVFTVNIPPINIDSKISRIDKGIEAYFTFTPGLSHCDLAFKSTDTEMNADNVCLFKYKIGETKEVNVSLDKLSKTKPLTYRYAAPSSTFKPGEKFVTTIYLYPNNFKHIVDHYRYSLYKVISLLGDDSDKSPEFMFDSIKTKSPDDVAMLLYQTLSSQLNVHTDTIISNENDSVSIKREKKRKEKEIKDKQKKINDLKSLNDTSKREVEINLNKIRRMRDTNFVLMVVMIVIGCLIIIPIISKLGLVPKGIAIGIWAVALLILLGYMAYSLYFTDMNRDDLDYNKFNWKKPSDKEVALSKAKATLNDSDKARCQAFAELEEELEIPNVDKDVIDVNDYISKIESAGKKCGD